MRLSKTCVRWAAAIGLSAAILPGAALAHGRPHWTGFYLGANVGYGWGDADTDAASVSSTRTRVFRAFGLPAQTLVSDVTTSTGLGGSASADVDGWLGGGQIGYNWRMDQWVLGLEADFQWTGQDGSHAFCAAPCAAGSPFANASYDLDWFGTVRGRAGFLIDPRLLVYATGGLAYGRVDATYEAGIVSGPSAAFGEDATKAGWTIGGGGEWKIDDNFSIKAEYLYVDLGEIASAGGSTSSTVISPNVPNQGFTTVVDTTTDGALSTRFTDHIFRIGVNYRLGDRREYAPLK